MAGPVPPILWYLLCVVAFAVFPLVMVVAIHRHRMKALELLRFYAEKGVEPPPLVTDLLMKQISDSSEKWKSTTRGSLLHTFGIHLFIACWAGGIAWWRIDAGGPNWAVYAAVVSAVFFGVHAFALLVAALKTPAP